MSSIRNVMPNRAYRRYKRQQLILKMTKRYSLLFKDYEDSDSIVKNAIKKVNGSSLSPQYRYTPKRINRKRRQYLRKVKKNIQAEYENIE